ncbi:MAG: hypothetical protein WA771_07495 [Chthoniobacterales bacterium]
MRLSVLLVGLVWCAALGVPTASGADKIWTGLVLATTEEPAKPVEEDLEPFVDEIREIFGYNSYYLLRQKKEKILEGTEEWVVPTKKFFLKLRCTERTETAYRLNIELYAEDRFILTSDVELARDAPLFIRGPQWGKGRLIFVMEVR